MCRDRRKSEWRLAAFGAAETGCGEDVILGEEGGEQWKAREGKRKNERKLDVIWICGMYMWDMGCAGCRKLDVGCGMRDVGCGMWDVGCEMRDKECEVRNEGMVAVSW